MLAIVIIPHSLKSLAEQAVRQLAPQSEGESFTVPLCPVGQEAITPNSLPTHWACLPVVSTEVAEQIHRLLSSAPFLGQGALVTCDPDEAVESFRLICAEWKLVQMEGEEPKAEGLMPRA